MGIAGILRLPKPRRSSPLFYWMVGLCAVVLVCAVLIRILP
jgi:hypothetical protein